jgi:hypothetical protein
MSAFRRVANLSVINIPVQRLEETTATVYLRRGITDPVRMKQQQGGYLNLLDPVAAVLEDFGHIEAFVDMI